MRDKRKCLFFRSLYTPISKENPQTDARTRFYDKNDFINDALRPCGKIISEQYFIRTC
jgi:hypothetical protein